jgi:hypothetical protein
MSRDRLEKELIEAVNAGLSAEDVGRFVLGPIRARRAEIHALLESDGLMVSGIMIDRGVVNMPHLITESLRIELRVLRSIEDSISGAMQRGLEARERLEKLDQPSKQDQPTRLHF